MTTSAYSGLAPCCKAQCLALKALIASTAMLRLTMPAEALKRWKSADTRHIEQENPAQGANLVRDVVSNLSVR